MLPVKCVVCGNDIPFVTNTGKRVNLHWYSTRKVCLSEVCRKKHRKSCNTGGLRKPKYVQVELTAIDLFNAGRLNEI